MFLLLLIFFNTSLCALNSSISFFNTKKSYDLLYTEDVFWHLDFFNSYDFSNLLGKNIQIVIIDKEISPDYSKKEINYSNLKKIGNRETKSILEVINQKNKNLSLCLMQKKYSLQKIIKKNHAEITRNLILQIAPQAKVHLISALDKDGNGSKQELYQALKQASLIKPDILHLGIQVTDFDPKLDLDKKILKILKKFKYIVASAGNYGEKDNRVGFPACCPFVISVGSFYKKENRYPISDFCQTLNKVDFIMPGENIWVETRIPEMNDYFFIPTTGTSISAALMTGCMACLLEKHSKNRSRIKKILQKTSKKLDESWNNTIIYGLPLMTNKF